MQNAHIVTHFCVLGIHKDPKIGKMGQNGGKKCVNNIEENNEVIVHQIHKYIIQVGRRQKQ